MSELTISYRLKKVYKWNREKK